MTKPTMKKIIILLTVFILGCDDNEIFEYKEYPFTVITKNGKGLGVEYSRIKCDSFEFISTKEVVIWIDNTKMKVMADRHIEVHSNRIKTTKPMTTKEIQNELGKYCILKGHFPVAENIKYLISDWELDVISMTKSEYLWEYEVKISLNDFRADKRKLRKHEWYSSVIKRYIPNYFVYCCPNGLIPPNELPEYAGLYYVSEDKIKEIIKPKLLHKTKFDKQVLMEKCLRVYQERHFLGCCLMTYKNKEKQRIYEENFKQDAR